MSTKVLIKVDFSAIVNSELDGGARMHDGCTKFFVVAQSLALQHITPHHIKPHHITSHHIRFTQPTNQHC